MMRFKYKTWQYRLMSPLAKELEGLARLTRIYYYLFEQMDATPNTSNVYEAARIVYNIFKHYEEWC